MGEAVVMGVAVVSVLVVFADVVLPAVVVLPAAVVLPFAVLDTLPVFAVRLVELPVFPFWASIDKTLINANPKISALFLAIPRIFLNLIIIILLLLFYGFKDKECLN
jgi:hypothetical protein